MSYKYMVLDSQSIPVARAILENHPESRIWQIRVLDNGVNAILEHEMLQLVGMDEGSLGMIGRVLRARGDVVEVEPVTSLGEEVRQNLRVHVNFDTFIYTLDADGRVVGRIPALAHDLSCGGIAFFSVRELNQGQLLEVVITITEQPLILKIQVLRPRPSPSKVQLYAAKFIELSNDEEKILREAVFCQQIKNSHKKNGKASVR